MKKKSFFFNLTDFKKAPSENVAAMAKMKGLSFIFLFQNITFIHLGKATTFQQQTFFRFRVILQKPQRELKNIPPSH